MSVSNQDKNNILYNLTNIIGFFSKKEIEFVEFVEKNELIDLCDALDHVKEIMVNSHNELIKMSLENV